MAVNIVLSASEKDNVATEKSHRRLSWREHTLLYSGQVVVAVIGGGMVSTLVRVLGVAGTWPFAIGAISGVVILVWRLVSICCQSEASPNHTDLSLQNKAMQIVRITNIVKAAPVLDLEDFGPGYIVETVEGDQVYFSGQAVAEYDHDGESLSTTVVLEVVGKDVVGVEINGEIVPVAVSQSVSISQLTIEPTNGFAILRHSGADQCQG